MVRRRLLVRSLASRPLQASKLIGIGLGLLLGVGGFFRLVSADAVVDNPVLADGQFLALIFVPLIGLGVVCVVVFETAVTAYQVLRSEASVRAHIEGRLGYVLVRGLEAGVAVGGAALMVSVAPTLFGDATPAPVGVGVMVLLMVIGVGVLVASLLRALAELYWVSVSG